MSSNSRSRSSSAPRSRRSCGPLEQKTFIDISTLINAVIVFVITAAAVYFVLVLPLQKLNELRGVTPKEAAKTDDQRLLEEIRDILREQRA